MPDLYKYESCLITQLFEIRLIQKINDNNIKMFITGSFYLFFQIFYFGFLNHYLVSDKKQSIFFLLKQFIID